MKFTYVQSNPCGIYLDGKLVATAPNFTTEEVMRILRINGLDLEYEKKTLQLKGFTLALPEDLSNLVFSKDEPKTSSGWFVKIEKFFSTNYNLLTIYVVLSRGNGRT